MDCPHCYSSDTYVLDSGKKSGPQRNRVHNCRACSERFRSTQFISVQDLKVVKRDTSIEFISLSKLRQSVIKASRHAPIHAADIDAMVNRVSTALVPLGAKENISSRAIGEMVLEQLNDGSDSSNLARIRFAMMFYGRRSKSTNSRGLDNFLEWLEESYGNRPINFQGASPTLVFNVKGGNTERRETANRSVENFDRRRLLRSVIRAAKGRGDDTAVEAFAQKIVNDVMIDLEGNYIVTPQQIGSLVLQQLIKKDAMAYLWYASAVKEYRSLDDFWFEALALENHKNTRSKD